MAPCVLRQNPDYRKALCELVNRFLIEREWSPARLARESGQSKATISRITNYQNNGDPNYRPQIRTIFAVALALKLDRHKRQLLFETAFPEWMIYSQAADKEWSVQETNELLYNKGLPPLTTDK